MKERKETPEWEKFSKMFNWVARSKALSAFEKLLYTRLRGHLGNNTKAWPGMKTLASELGSGVSQVAKGLKHLEELRLILVIRRHGRDHKRLSNEYEFPSHAMMYEIAEVSTGCEDPLFSRESTPTPPGEYPYSLGRIYPIHPAGTEETHNKRLSEETQGRDSISGSSLRSPLDVSLRSTSYTSNLTQNQIPKHESEFTNKRGFAAISSSSALALVEDFAEVHLEEEDMSDEERAARIASGLRVAQMAANKTNVEEAKKAAKRKEKEKWQAAASVAAGELPVIKPPKQKPMGVLLDLERLWRAEFKSKFPTDSMEACWGPKEGAMLRGLLQRWSQLDLEQAIRYFLRYWEQQKLRFPKLKANLPSLGMFRAYDASVVPDSKVMFVALKAKTDYDKWCAANPSATSAPDDLQASYDAARPSLKTLGL